MCNWPLASAPCEEIVFPTVEPETTTVEIETTTVEIETTSGSGDGDAAMEDQRIAP